MARKFLYVIAGLIVLLIAAAIAFSIWGNELTRMALVPKTPFEAVQPPAPSVYDDPKMWIARPDIAGNPALWQPEREIDGGPKGTVPVFFIHPTSYIDRAHWNAPLDDNEANDRARIFVRGQASVFARAGEVWAPRYRQAAFGAFLTDDPRGQQAISAAYQDVLLAFDAFLKGIGRRDFIFAGHSQGSLHLIHLLKDRIAGTPLAKRVLAAYVIGWPVSVEADLPALGLPACTATSQKNCIVSFNSFAEPADTGEIEKAFDATPSLTGKQRVGTKILCTNPLTGGTVAEAPATANLGTLKNEPDFSGGILVKGAASARCDDRGFLLIGDPPELGPYVMPGNNYHVYDYSLFWANLSDDALARVTGSKAP
jgi:hypothetical protein